MKRVTNHITAVRLAALGVLLALLAWGVVSGVSSAGDPEPLPPQLAIVPQDGFLFMHLRPAELWESDPAVKLRKLYPRETALAKNAPLDIADVESVSIVLPSAQSLLALGDMGTKKRVYPKGEFKVEPKFSPKGEPKFDDPKKEPAKKEPEFKDFKDDPPKDLKEPAKDFKKPTASDRGDDLPRLPAGMVILTMVNPLDPAKITQLLGKDVAEEKHNDKTYFTSPLNVAVHFLNKRTVVAVSPAGAMKKLLESPQQTRPGGKFAAALDLANKKRQVVVGVNMLEPAAQGGVKGVSEAMKDPRREEPVWTLTPLLATRSASLGLEVKENKVQLSASMSYADPESANEAMGAAKDALTLARIFFLGRASFGLRMIADEQDDPTNVLFLGLLLKQVETGWRAAVIDRRAATVQFQAEVPLDVDALEAQAKAAAKSFVKDDTALMLLARRQSSNNLKQIARAMHYHNDVYKQLPLAATVNPADGKPLLSWRVALLPYVDEGKLHAEFKQDEPWNSPHNIKLLARMPKVYAPVRGKTKEPFCTYYQGFNGRGTTFESEVKKMGDTFIALPLAIPRSFPDGTSNTIAIVEAGEAVPWTKPEDLPYDAKKPLPALGGMFNGGFHAALMDASVRFIGGVAKEGVAPLDVPKGFVSQETLRAAITRDGGEALGPDW